MKLLVANWKMNPTTEKSAVLLAKRVDSKGVVICPPFEFLSRVGAALKKSSLGAQDVFWKKQGAFTGEISPLMLKDAGVEYVIIGHSERRALGETDAMINLKIKASLRAGLKIILCVGEPLRVHRRGFAASRRFVLDQLKLALRGVGDRNLLVAYEPIWAISTSGTGLVDTPDEAGKMAESIKKSLPGVKVLYGGSVTSKNAAGFVKYPSLHGALVGGASLRADEFRQIIRAAAGK